MQQQKEMTDEEALAEYERLLNSDESSDWEKANYLAQKVGRWWQRRAQDAQRKCSDSQANSRRERDEKTKMEWLDNCEATYPDHYQRLKDHHKGQDRNDPWRFFHPPMNYNNPTTGAEPFLCGIVRETDGEVQHVCSEMFNSQEALDEHHLISHGRHEDRLDNFDFIQGIFDKYPKVEVGLIKSEGKMHHPKTHGSKWSCKGHLIGSHLFWWQGRSYGHAEDSEGNKWYLEKKATNFCKRCFKDSQWDQNNRHWEGVV